ncbi:MAG: hypothetical protein ACFBWO_08190 [Paracoccaceae bacterium]
MIAKLFFFVLGALTMLGVVAFAVSRLLTRAKAGQKRLPRRPGFLPAGGVADGGGPSGGDGCGGND